jgi:hypothetical protein
MSEVEAPMLPITTISPKTIIKNHFSPAWDGGFADPEGTRV